MCKFKRSIRNIVSSILLVAMLICSIEILLESNFLKNEVSPTMVILLILIYFFLIVFVIVQYIMPPDFEYIIRLSNDVVIFEFSDEDCRKIDKNFSITRRTGRYIVLYDGFSRMRIPYNEEVIQFLDEIKN